MMNMRRVQIIVFILSIITIFSFLGCTKNESGSASADKGSGGSGAAESLGVGPVTSKIQLESQVNTSQATRGKAVFESKCTACHKFDSRYVGPALGGVTKRRRPEWIMNMILNPSEMIQKDETAKALLAEYLTQMANQNLTQDEARAVLEYFRQHDSVQ